MSRQINYKQNSTPGSLYNNPKTSPQSPVDTAELVATTSPQSSALSPQPSDPKALDVAQICDDLLRSGILVRFRAPGDSMYPTICDCDLITVEPMEPSDIKVSDIILYRHENGVVAHRVINIEAPESSTLSPQHFFTVRGDAAINYDAPVSSEQILGKVVSIERNGRRIDPYNFRVKLLYKARRLAARLKRLLFLSPKLP